MVNEALARTARPVRPFHELRTENKLSVNVSVLRMISRGSQSGSQFNVSATRTTGIQATC